MSQAPDVCMYCRGTGYAWGSDRSDPANECGFCDAGKPLDTQEDWDRTWGRINDLLAEQTIHRDDVDAQHADVHDQLGSRDVPR